MKIWKITNISPIKEPIKFAFKLGPINSRGVILKYDEFILVQEQMTSVMEAQERRRFIHIDKEFDNSLLNIEVGKAFSNAYLKTQLDELNKPEPIVETIEVEEVVEVEEIKDKLEEAKDNIEKYINDGENI